MFQSILHSQHRYRIVRSQVFLILLAKLKTRNENVSKLDKNLKHLKKTSTAAIFKIKVNILRLSFVSVNGNMKKKRQMINIVYGINSNDYINNYSDKHNRRNLISSFVKKHSFRVVGTTLQYKNHPSILKNTKSAGTKIGSYTNSISDFSMSVKYYHKMLPNFVAGDAQKHVGSHFSEYVSYPNQHFKKTFTHQKSSGRR